VPSLSGAAVSIDWHARYRDLRAALQRYDRALRRYGLFGDAWVEHSEELDELYASVLKTADIDSPAATTEGRDD